MFYLRQFVSLDKDGTNDCSWQSNGWAKPAQCKKSLHYSKQTLGNFFYEILTEDRSVTESYKPNCIAKYVSADVCDNISDCKTYDEAITLTDIL